MDVVDNSLSLSVSSSLSSSSDAEIDDDSLPGELQKFCDNDVNFPQVKDKIPFIIGIRLLLKDPPDLKQDPYGQILFKKKQKSFKPTIFTLKIEATRRDCVMRKTNLTSKYLIQRLSTVPLCVKDISYVTQKELQFRQTLQQVITAHEVAREPGLSRKAKILDNREQTKVNCCYV